MKGCTVTQDLTVPKRDTDRIIDYSVLMQIRALVLSDLRGQIPVDYYAAHALPSKLAVYESENLDRLRHLTRVDFNLSKELGEANDRYPTFTPREVSATEVLNLVAYYLMFVGLDKDQLTPHRLGRMSGAASKLRAALNVYAHHLDETDMRLISAALKVSTFVETYTPQPSLTLDVNAEPDTPIELADESDRALPGDSQLDFDLLATRAQLLIAFEVWGLKESWFSELSSHTWLKAARRVKGRGQRGRVVEPLFCPLAVMNGLATSIRGRPRLRLEKGWDLLEQHFPSVSHANSVADPREQTG